MAVRVVDITQQIDTDDKDRQPFTGTQRRQGALDVIGHRSPRRQTRRLVVLECELESFAHPHRVIDIAEGGDSGRARTRCGGMQGDLHPPRFAVGGTDAELAGG